MKQNSNALNVYVAGKIEEVRTNADVPIEMLAKKTDIRIKVLENIENGFQTITVEQLYSIAEELNVPVSDLLPDIEWFKENKSKKIIKVVSFHIEEETTSKK